MYPNPLRGIGLIATFLISFALGAQNMHRVQATIDSLCSPEFAGRGYFPQGDLKTALFLVQRFMDMGLEPLKDKYLQPFPIKINVVTSQPVLSSLRVGKDFIVWAGSGSGSRTAKTTRDSSQCADKVLVMSQNTFQTLLSGRRDMTPFLKAAAWVVESPKLTHTALNFSLPLPVFEVLGRFEHKKIRYSVQTQIISRNSQNVMAMVKGRVRPDSFLLVTAHYDHLGTMGSTFFPGANDNASGVAMLLELADWISRHPPRYSAVFICFSGEEAGLVGSKFFVDNSPVSLAGIRFLLNLDLLGTGEDGATVVNGSIFKEEFALLDSLNRSGGFLPKLLTRGRAANSDHHYFTEAGVRSFFIYQMGQWPHYHDINDKPPLPLTSFEATFKLLLGFLEMLSEY